MKLKISFPFSILNKYSFYDIQKYDTDCIISHN